MKTKLFVLTMVAALGGGLLCAQDAPKPPPPGDKPPGGEGGPGPGGRPGGPGGDQRPGFDEVFKKMDANGDGKVSKEEYVEFRKKEAEEQFSKLDPENSGAVDKAKMQETFNRYARRPGGDGGARRPEGGTSPEGFRRPEGSSPEGFRRPGGEGGGTRQRPGSEGKPADGTPPPPPAPGASAEGRGPGGPGAGGMRGGSTTISEILRLIQEKGEVTKEDYAKISDEQFKRLDTNGDGKISKDEMEEISRRMQQFSGRGRGDGQGRPPGGEGQGGFRRPGGEGTKPAPEGARPKPE